jgi:hypothetical protein
MNPRCAFLLFQQQEPTEEGVIPPQFAEAAASLILPSTPQLTSHFGRHGPTIPPQQGLDQQRGRGGGRRGGREQYHGFFLLFLFSCGAFPLRSLDLVQCKQLAELLLAFFLLDFWVVLTGENVRKDETHGLRMLLLVPLLLLLLLLLLQLLLLVLLVLQLLLLMVGEVLLMLLLVVVALSRCRHCGCRCYRCCCCRLLLL